MPPGATNVAPTELPSKHEQIGSIYLNISLCRDKQSAAQLSLDLDVWLAIIFPVGFPTSIAMYMIAEALPCVMVTKINPNNSNIILKG